MGSLFAYHHRDICCFCYEYLCTMNEMFVNTTNQIENQNISTNLHGNSVVDAFDSISIHQRLCTHEWVLLNYLGNEVCNDLKMQKLYDSLYWLGNTLNYLSIKHTRQITFVKICYQWQWAVPNNANMNGAKDIYYPTVSYLIGLVRMMTFEWTPGDPSCEKLIKQSNF